MPKSKPSKPRKDFPLFAHNNGQWAKKVRGRLHYFGPWADTVAAEEEWERRKHDLLAGRESSQATLGDSVGWLVNTFMDSKELQRDQGDATQRTYLDYKRVAKHLADYFGRGRRLDSLQSIDIERYRGSLPSSWGPATVNNHLRYCRAIFRHAKRIHAVPNGIPYEIGLRHESRAAVRKHAAKQPPKTFTAEQIRKLLATADAPMQAFVYLGINCAYGTMDIARLTLADIDLGNCRLSVIRGKTGVARDAWLWPETVQAVREAIDARFEPHNAEWADLAFTTRNRRPWAIDGSTSHPLTQAFRNLKEAAGINAKGRGHYSLRHTFATVAGDSRDQIAVNTVMGHADASMAGNYRHGIDHARVRAVCEHVRNWLTAGVSN